MVVRVGCKSTFLPHLEESCRTIQKERGEKEDDKEESEISEDSGGMGSLEGGSESGTGKSRQQASIDSGIVIRFGFTSFLHPPHHEYPHQPPQTWGKRATPASSPPAAKVSTVMMRLWT